MEFEAFVELQVMLIKNFTVCDQQHAVNEFDLLSRLTIDVQHCRGVSIAMPYDARKELQFIRLYCRCDSALGYYWHKVLIQEKAL